ncbi:MAG: acyl-CoA dehydrogenase family protein [Acetobacteraceae bacterium]|nr:acyl-CoA dehydrogenase family protein [Acetobacteraceae bacterium]
MDFRFTEEQEMIRKLARDLTEKEVIPKVAEWDASGRFPRELFARMGELGLLGLPFPEEWGGAGADTLSYVLVLEELARGSLGVALSYEAHVSLGCTPLYLFGTEEQKRKYLVPCAQGKWLACFGLTEPGAGSDAGATQTTAVLDGDQWVINGTKCFITNASQAEVAVITAVTAKGMGTRGISAFIVPRGAPGFRVGKAYDKLGVRCSDTAELIFEDCRIPRENLLGELNQGFKQFLKTLDGGRLGVAALAVGLAQACLDQALRYAQQRVQFGQPLSKFQAVQFKLADMAAELDVARWYTYRLAVVKDEGARITKEAAIAKLFASEAAARAATQAVQILGAYGFSSEYPVERFYRDAKLLEIGEGTSEIQRLVIARELGC